MNTFIPQFNSLLSSLGGALSLMLGISIACAFEFGFVLIKVICSVICGYPSSIEENVSKCRHRRLFFIIH